MHKLVLVYCSATVSFKKVFKHVPIVLTELLTKNNKCIPWILSNKTNLVFHLTNLLIYFLKLLKPFIGFINHTIINTDNFIIT